MLAAVSARDQAGEWVSAGKALPDRSVFLGPLCNFGLYRLIILQADNGLVRTLCVVHRQLALVDHGLFRQVVFPESLLKKQVSGVGVIVQDA